MCLPTLRDLEARHSVARRPKGAFTLVELLVVIAIIGVLVALLLPAIQAAREAARRIQCQSQLHNLALAVANYESAKKELPPSSDMKNSLVSGRGGSSYGLQEYTGKTQFSWIVRILPYIELQTLADQFDPDLGPIDTSTGTNMDAVFYQNTLTRPEEKQPSVLLCPSDSSQGRFYAHTSFANGRTFAKGNYAAYSCPEHSDSSRVWPGALVHQPQELRRVTDGTSNTIMLTEIRTREDPNDERGAWALAWSASTILGADMHGITPSSSGANVGDQLVGEIAYVPDVAVEKGALPPNKPPASGNDDGLRDCPLGSEIDRLSDLEGMPCNELGSHSAAPRSLHPGGVNGANIDGSVRYLLDEISPSVLGLIICINDGTVLPGD